MPAPATETLAPQLQTDGADAAGSRYCTFVQPRHPLVEELFPPLPADGEDAVAAALAVLRRECAYRSRAGRRGLDELLATRRASGGGRLEINCIDLVCLLVSYLRSAGAGDDEAFVALAGIRGFLQHHAWALVRRNGGFLWIDPAALEPVARPGREILERHDLYVVFNDRRIFFTGEEKRRLLAGERP